MVEKKNIFLKDFINIKIKKINIIKKSHKFKKNNYVNTNFEFTNSIIGNYLSYWDSPGGWSIKLYGNKKTIVFDPLENGYIIDEKFKKKIIHFDKFDKKFKPGLYLQAKEFVKLLKNQKNNSPNLLTSYNTMKICQKIYV